MADYQWHEHGEWKGHDWTKKSRNAKSNDPLRKINLKGSKDFLRIKLP
jgi:hypothetical protein